MEDKASDSKTDAVVTLLEGRGKRVLAVDEILFTQASVASTFSDGRSVAELAEGLRNDTKSKEAVKYIRVTRFRDKWFSLDNRRLRAFKDAGVQTITVWVLPFSEAEKEFFVKYSSPTIDEGGQLRKHAPLHSGCASPNRT